MNPFNCSLPGNLFAGYQNERNRIVVGLLENQKSFAVFGGRRCGKTSLLMQLEKDIRAKAPKCVQPRFIDMQAIVPRTAGEFFCALYKSIIVGLPEAPVAPQTLRDFSEFLGLLGQVSTLIESHFGPQWLLVLLVDELDSAASSLQDDTAFQNLRHLLTMSAYSGAFRVIVTGSRPLDNLICSGSPLNILEPVYLGVLLDDDAEMVIRAGFQNTTINAALMAETGRHPYILQGVLAYLWEDRHSPDVAIAARRFAKDRTSNFKHWLRDIGEDGVAVYRAVATSQKGIEKAAFKTRKALRDEVLQTLVYHGIVECSDDRLRVSSKLFCRWFLENVASETESPISDPKAAKTRKVFVVHGRNHRARAAMFLLLRELGLQPLEWGDLVEATGNPAPTILEILRAVLILRKPRSYCLPLKTRLACTPTSVALAILRRNMS
jgi:hypothetical protein